VDADEPVAINALKRFVVDWATNQEDEPYKPERESDNGLKVAVIGSGPSGLSAAHDLYLRGYNVTVFDAAERPGGLLAHGIPEYRLPPDALERDVVRILDLGINFKGNTHLGRDIHLKKLIDGEFDAVYLAMGAGKALTLDIPRKEGAAIPSLVTALEYLERVARGSDVETGCKVVVVGGGNAAIDAARTSLRKGAKRVCVTCLEHFDEMPAIREEILAAQQEGIELYPGLRPLNLEPQGIILVPVDNDAGTRTRLVADQIILAIGQIADFEELALDDLALNQTPDGYLQVDPETACTSHPRIFAGGDLVKGEQTVTAAMAAGLRAAWGIDAALRDKHRADRRPPPPRTSAPEESTTQLSVPNWLRTGRVTPEELALKTRTRNFEEVVKTYSEAQARSEAARCLMCGQCGNCRACIELFGCPGLRRTLPQRGNPDCDL
jgi:NADPH-dependent glutamate synthase beta subunit-like oxidoreductase